MQITGWFLDVKCQPCFFKVPPFSLHLPRVAGLEPIVETVREFDVLKIPLEEWCNRQREFFDNLPPLEVRRGCKVCLR